MRQEIRIANGGTPALEVLHGAPARIGRQKGGIEGNVQEPADVCRHGTRIADQALIGNPELSITSNNAARTALRTMREVFM